MEQLSKKYSLDWLVTGARPKAAFAPVPLVRETAESSGGVSGTRQRGISPLDEAVIIYSEPIRVTLRENNGVMRLHDLVEKVNQKHPVGEFEQFVAVVNYLRELGFVTYLDKDLRGNHQVKLLK